jgi:hypothetical protein
VIKSLIPARRFLAAVSGAVRSVVAPTTLFQPATEPEALYSPADMPAVEDIEAAAAEYQRAAEQARRADRGKRAARKILDRLPVGRYGTWQVDRVASGRETVDLNEVRRIFKQHGLGPVPMKTSAPSLKVTRTAVEPLTAHTAADLVAA